MTDGGGRVHCSPMVLISSIDLSKGFLGAPLRSSRLGASGLFLEINVIIVIGSY
jgi:hypothetical protein